MKDEKKMEKKGEISSAWLITIILLVLGFAILLIFLYNVYWNQSIDREICHESVILRASVPSLIEKYVPLKCQTSKICITSGLIGGSCEEFIGEKGITKLKVSSGEKGETEIEKFYAREILDCWTMMGEGKISLFSNHLANTYGIGSVYPTCVICSRIAFDYDSLENAGINLSKIDIAEYMYTHLIPDTNTTYLKYIAGENGDFKINEGLFEEGTQTPLSTDEIKIVEDAANQIATTNIIQIESAREIDFTGKEHNDSTAVLFMQISSPKGEEVFTNTIKAAASVAGFGFALAPITSLKTLGGFVKAPTLIRYQTRNALGQFSKMSYKLAGGTVTKLGIITAVLAVIGLGTQQANVAWQRSVTAGKCSDVKTGSDAYDGCTVVRAVPYNEEDISTYCSVIESIP